MFNVGDKLLIVDGNHSQVVNYRGPASSDSSMVWTGTMQIAIANDKLVKFDEHETAELRRREQATDWPQPYSALVREQAQHTAAAINLQPVDIRKDNDTWLLLYADRETAYLAASAAKCAPELAAENERLRGLLAQMVGIVDHLLNLNGDDLSRAALEPSDTLSSAHFAAIEAAKEAVK